MATVEELRLEIKAEVADAISKLKSFERETKNTRTGLSALSGAFADMAHVMQGPMAIAGKVAGALRQVAQVGTELYNSFGEAERAGIIFSQALKDNGNMADGAGKRLSDFASQLEKTTQFEGDATVAIMGNLAAMGLSEDKIHDLVQAATNLAAATGIDLETAVKQLNATLQGNAGMLGRQNAAVKALTTEQLKNGEAVRLVNEQYKGMAEVLGTSAFGAAEKLKNEMGNLREAMGRAIATDFKPLVTKISAAAAAAAVAINDKLDLGMAVSGRGSFSPDRIRELMKVQAEGLRDIRSANELKKYNDEMTALSLAYDVATSGIKRNAITNIVVSNAAAVLAKELEAEALALAEAGAEAERYAFAIDNAAEATVAMLRAAKGKPISEAIIGDPAAVSEIMRIFAGGLPIIYEAQQSAVDLQIELGRVTPNTTAVIDEQAKAWEEYGKQVEAIGQTAFKNLSEAFGAALVSGEEGWSAYGKAAVEAIAAVVESLGQQFAIMAAGSFFSNPLAAAGYTAAAFGAYAAAGAIRAGEAKMADGGIVTRPTHALIGEAGPEAVIPLGKGGFGMTVNQYIAGSVLSERQLRQFAVGAVNNSNRGY